MHKLPRWRSFKCPSPFLQNQVSSPFPFAPFSSLLLPLSLPPPPRAFPLLFFPPPSLSSPSSVPLKVYILSPHHLSQYLPPPPPPPTLAQVIVAQQEFQGITPEQAQGNDFQGALAQAVADQLDVDPSFVTITSTTEGEGGAVVIMYVVQGVDAADVGDAQEDLQNRDMAAAIGANLHDAGFDDAEVGPADTGMANVQVSTIIPSPSSYDYKDITTDAP